jgi:hypothetical protein
MEMSFMKTFGRAAVASAYNSLKMLLNLSGKGAFTSRRPELAEGLAPTYATENLFSKTISCHVLQHVLQGRNSDPI